MDEYGHLGKLRWCDNRSRTYDLRITKASQLQNEYNNEYSKDIFLNKALISIR